MLRRNFGSPQSQLQKLQSEKSGNKVENRSRHFRTDVDLARVEIPGGDSFIRGASSGVENPDAEPPQTCCPIIELRQYTLHPGQRDVLIDLFDREFVESQEALGMKLIGHFRDVPSRAQALKDFYGGPVWKAHREAANATMIDSDNVLLLHPATATSGFSFGNKERPRVGANEARSELIVATIYYFDAPVEAGFFEFFEKTVNPAVIGSGGTVLAFLVTEHSENTLP